MSAKRVLSWLQKGWTAIVDPEREERLNGFVSAVHRELSARRDAFDFAEVSSRLEIADDEVDQVAKRLFTKCVCKAWADGDLSEKENRSLTSIARRLRIEDADARSLMTVEGSRVFTSALSAAFADGILDDSEYATLQRIATSCGTTPAAFFRSQFREEGEGFIRNLFLKVWEDGRMDQDEWVGMVKTIQRLGMSDTEFREAVRTPARQIVEHFLADFKSDGVITQDESTFLDWMLANLISEHPFQEYVRAEIAQTNRFADIRAGRLPSEPTPVGVALRSGEIVHFKSACRYTQLRRRGGEVVRDRCEGLGVVTDDRFLFISPTQSLYLIHSKILGYQRRRNGLEIQCSGKGAGEYEFATDTHAGTEIWITAIGRANQTIVTPREEKGSRHIPRDVRQRVWQRYGGRCAECDSSQYLEFDHIIPNARGGGNSDNNVQLLCRACNSKKSDSI